MKILHTSDWHLGRRLHGVDLGDATGEFLADLTALVSSEKPDALLISGDLFDRQNPPVAVVNMARDGLRKLCELTRVIIIPGNHDSGERLAFTQDFLSGNLVIRADIEDIDKPVMISDDQNQQLAVYTIPYLRVDYARQQLCDNPGDPEQFLPRNPQAVMSAALRRVHADLVCRRKENPQLSALAMVHTFIAGGQGSDSERNISVGGIELVPLREFATLGGADPEQSCPLDYVAAGHLHRPQLVSDSRPLIRYSGSPLAFSFSEASHLKSVTLVEFRADQLVWSEHHTPVHRRLGVIRDSIEAVESGAYAHLADYYVSAHITNSEFPADMRNRVRKLFAHLLHVIHEPPQENPASHPVPVVSAEDNPVDVCTGFFEAAGGVKLSAAQRKLVEKLVEDIRAQGEAT